MHYPVCGMVHIKKYNLLDGNNSSCSGSSEFISVNLNYNVQCNITVYNNMLRVINQQTGQHISQDLLYQLWSAEWNEK